VVRSTTRPSLPDVGEIESIEEPYIKVTIHVPSEYVGAVLKLCRTAAAAEEHGATLSPTA
jgi:GTP-binding protein LepA